MGSISAVSSDLAIFSSASSHTGLRLANGYIAPTNNSVTISDNTADLGISNYRFKDLFLSGGAYIGGTGSANYLDDYEEGTWTPTYSGSNSNPTVSFTSQIARYTKVGRLVSVWGYLRVNSTSGGDGSLSIEGLPFTSANTNYVAGTVGYAHNWVSNATPTRLLVKTNSSTIRLYRQNTSDPRAGMENVVISSMANGLSLIHI